MELKLTHKVFQGMLFFLFLDSLSAWFTWNLSNYVYLLNLVVSFLFFLSYKTEFLFKKYSVPIFLYIIAMLSLGITLDVGGILGFLCKVVPVCLFIATKSNFKKSTLQTITEYWLYLLIPSLFLF